MGTGVLKRGVVSIVLVFGLVFSMITFTPLASSGDWVNRPAPGGEIIEVVQGDNFLIRHRLEWDQPENGGYTIIMGWDCYDNHENENFTFLSAEAYFDLDNDNLPDSGLDPILTVVTLISAPSPDYPGSTRYGLSVSCPADQKDPRNGQFNVDIWMGAYGAGGVPHIPTENHPILEQFAGIIIIEPSPQFLNRAPITISIQALAEWQLVETWTGTVSALAAWQLVEAWTGTVEAPSAWQLIETWTGVVEAPAEWQLVETWTGTVKAPAEWKLIETWAGIIRSPVVWKLIEIWTGVVEAPAAWQLIETWAGTVSTPIAWQLIETWTEIISAPVAWQLIETWSGAIQAPTRWQLIETWARTVEAPAIWKLIETWTGTIETPVVWQLIEILTGTVEAPDTQAPPAPALLSPADGTTTDDTTPTFDWSDVTDPSGVTYTLEIIGTLLKTGLTTSTYTLMSGEALSDSNYSWRVRAIDNVGNESDWSDTRSLTVSTTPPPPPPPPPPPEVDEIPPPVPSLLSPANTENITDNTPLLDWSDVSDPSGVTYDLSIAGDAGFTSIVLEKTNLTASAYELTSAEALAVGTYYWRVRGVDGAGNVGSWSENWSFTYREIPSGLIENESPPIDIPSITTDENATIEVENTAITGMTIVVRENVENVRITVQQLTDKPAEIAIGAPGVTYAYLNVVSENITDADIDIVLINFMVEKAWITAQDIDPDSMVMRRWDSVAEVWVSLPTTRIGEDDTYYYYYQAESPGLSVFSIGYVLVPAHAEFEFSNLVIDPSEVRAGKAVTISVVVANVGDLRGSYNVILKIDNIIEAAESVTLAGGAMKTVTFTVSSEAEGTHDIEVEGLAGTFVVTPAPPSIVPLAITGGIVLLAGILIWLRRRRTRLKGAI